MAKKESIGIAGAGLFGTALAYLLGGNGYKVMIFTDDKKVVKSINEQHKNPRFPKFSALPEGVTASQSEEEFCRKSRTIFLAVSPQKVIDIIGRFNPFLEGDHLLVHTLRYLFGYPPKGLSKYIWDNTLVKKVAILSGPVYMDEMMNNNPSTLVVASPFEQVRIDLLEMLTTPYIRLYQDDDVEAVEWGSAFANIGLIFVGIAAGQGYGASTQSALISRMVFEISTVLKNLGKDGNLANGLTGMGIIAAGAIRRDSLFFEMGYRMGKEMNAEKAKANLRYGDAGPVFLENIYKWSKENNIDLPLTEAIHKIFIEKIDLKEIRMWLFNRPFRKEFD